MPVPDLLRPVQESHS
jgi:hypothetical protein